MTSVGGYDYFVDGAMIHITCGSKQSHYVWDKKRNEIFVGLGDYKVRGLKCEMVGDMPQWTVLFPKTTITADPGQYECRSKSVCLVQLCCT